MAVTSLTLGHIAIFRMDELVNEGLRIAARKSFRDGDLRQAAGLLDCNMQNRKKLLALMTSLLPDVGGSIVWSPQFGHKVRKELETEIERALVRALGQFGSTYDIADFYGTNPTLVQRRSRGFI
jgi:hypothetical protein